MRRYRLILSANEETINDMLRYINMNVCLRLQITKFLERKENKEKENRIEK